MSQVIAENFLPSVTGFDLGTATQQWDVFAQNIDCSGTASFTGAVAFTALEGIQFADHAAGVTVTNKIDNALAAAATVAVLVPSTMGAGNATAITGSRAVLDFRAGWPKVLTGYSASSPAWQVNGSGVTIMAAMASDTANVASAGQIRLAKSDVLKFRNNANGGDVLGLSKDTSDVVQVGDTAGAKVGGQLAISGAFSGATTISASGQITSSLVTGTAPFSIASTTVVPNLNVATVNGVTVSGSASANQVLTASSGSAASWAALPATSKILNKQDILAAITGDATDKTIYTYSLPSGTLAAAQGIRVTTFGEHTAGTAALVIKFAFGATSMSVTGSTTAAGKYAASVVVFNNAGSTTAQWMASTGFNGAATPLTLVNTATPTENTNSGSPIVVKATFNIANTDQVTPRGWLVELVN